MTANLPCYTTQATYSYFNPYR